MVGGVKPPNRRADRLWVDCLPRRTCRLAPDMAAAGELLMCGICDDPFISIGNVGDILRAVSLKSFSNMASCKSSARGGYKGSSKQVC